MSLPFYQPFFLPTPDALAAEARRLGLAIPLAGRPATLATPVAGLPNRLCAQPITGLDAAPDGAPGPLTLRRHQRCAAGGFGLVWCEAATAGHAGPAGRLRLHPGTLDAFARFVAAVRAAAPQPPTIVLQLTAALPPGTAVHRLPHEPPDRPVVTDAELLRLRDGLAAAAALAARAGFDGVDVAANGGAAGGLLGAFTRAGRFGGPFEHRARFLLETVAAVRAASPGLLVATRLCACHAVRPPFGFGTAAADHRRHDLAEPVRLARLLRDCGVALLNVTSASPNLRGEPATRGLRPHSDHGHPDEHPLTVLARQLEIAAALRAAAPGLTVVGSGFSWLRHHFPAVAAAAVEQQLVDVAGLGRGALACPDAPRQLLDDGRLDPARCCIVCFACDALRHAGGPVGCPIHDPATYGPPFRGARAADPAALTASAGRCHQCEHAPCVAASRTGTDIPGFIDAFRRGDGAAAFRIIRGSDVLPEMTARLTPGWLHSEGACVEATLSGTPVPILDLQHAVAWGARARGGTGVALPPKATGRTVAIVGAGPAGLAAAIRLLERGHHVGLFESSATLGGTPERVIPAARFASARPEIDAILAPALTAGRLRIHHRATLGDGLSLEALLAGADLVLMAAGLWQEQSFGAAAGVLPALGFLEAAKDGRLGAVPPRVAVLAGGDCAMDAACTAAALGAGDVCIVFGGPRASMHWHLREDWFAEPGHHALMHCQPLGYQPGPGGRLAGVRVRHLRLETEAVLPADLVIEAAGLQPAAALRAALAGITFTDAGLVAVDHRFLTTHARVHAVGALVNGGASVARCVAEGLAAADHIHRRLAPGGEGAG